MQAHANHVRGLLTRLWQAVPCYSADGNPTVPAPIPAPTWHPRASLSVRQERSATNNYNK